MAKVGEGKQKEIERRWLVKNIPEEISRGMEDQIFRLLQIHQGYIPDKRGTRLRDQTEKCVHSYFVTWKEGQGVERDEEERAISRRRFNLDWQKVTVDLWKVRYFIPHGEKMIELNFFLGDLQGYRQIEVEFKTKEEAAAFVVPYWFGREVTDDKSHDNFILALGGLPKEDGKNEN